MDVVRQEAARGIRPKEANPGRGRGVDRAKTATASTPETGSASGSTGDRASGAEAATGGRGSVELPASARAG
jgi:hypothetical protein